MRPHRRPARVDGQKQVVYSPETVRHPQGKRPRHERKGLNRRPRFSLRASLCRQCGPTVYGSRTRTPFARPENECGSTTSLFVIDPRKCSSYCEGCRTNHIVRKRLRSNAWSFVFAAGRKLLLPRRVCKRGCARFLDALYWCILRVFSQTNDHSAGNINAQQLNANSSYLKEFFTEQRLTIRISAYGSHATSKSGSTRSVYAVCSPQPRR